MRYGLESSSISLIRGGYRPGNWLQVVGAVLRGRPFFVRPDERCLHSRWWMQPLSEAIDAAGNGVAGGAECLGDLAECPSLFEQGEQRIVVFGFPDGFHRGSPMLTLCTNA